MQPPGPEKLAVKRTAEFTRWYFSLEEDDRMRIDSRLDDMKEHLFVHSRTLGEGLAELKWRSGMRVYYTRKRISGVDVLALWGGFKGTQDKDIRKARRIMMRIIHENP